MRTNIVIDDALLAEALSCTGLSTKKAVIEEALRTLVRLKGQEQVRALRGRLRWEGDLQVMRESRIAYTAINDEPTQDVKPAMTEAEAEGVVDR